ncbi:MAG: hypothetical protein ACRDO2_15050 [Nocardioidaceae bacterium]
MSELPIILVQPRLQISTATAAKIAAGRAYQAGGVVREIGTERLVELLREAPEMEGAAEEVARNLKTARLSSLGLSKFEAPKRDAKTALAAGGVLLAAGVAVGGYRWVMGRREGAAATGQIEAIVGDIEDDDAREDPTCLTQFRTSLMAYVDAGTEGALTADVIESLVANLDAVRAYAEDGNVIVFTLDELLPFFELVTAHTPVLAAAYEVTLDEEDEASEGVVVSLRRHLEMQKGILSGAA